LTDSVDFFSIKSVFFTLANYPVSYIEFTGSLAGVAAVWLATRSNILTWPLGLINIILFFLIFWQVSLYSDVFLQVYFFIISIYGWINWSREQKEHIPLWRLSSYQRWITFTVTVLLTLMMGFLMSHIHHVFPDLFENPAAFPYADSFVAVTSVIANTLMAKRIVENWILWILVNLFGVTIYFLKDIIFVSIEYLIFLGLAIVGHFHWRREFFAQHKLETK